MQLKTILLGACTAAIACAQSTVLSFTRVPNPITAGKPTALTYATNDTSSPVTIILRRGVSTNLDTIETLTSDATGGQYIWTPSTSLENGNDYALEIKQGTQVNYFGPFTIQGGGASSSSSSASSTGTATASSNGTASAYPTHSGNSTMTGGSNTTISMTRTRSHSSVNPATITSTSVQTAVTTPETASTGGAGFQGTSSRAPTSTGAAAALQTGGSMLLLGLGAILFA